MTRNKKECKIEKIVYRITKLGNFSYSFEDYYIFKLQNYKTSKKEYV